MIHSPGIGTRPFKVLKNWGTNTPGDVIYPTGQLRDQYKQLGFIVQVEETAVEAARAAGHTKLYTANPVKVAPEVEVAVTAQDTVETASVAPVARRKRATPKTPKVDKSTDVPETPVRRRRKSAVNR